MCGIAGIFGYGKDSPPVCGDELLRVREAMASRGPDGAGLFVSDDRRIGLAHRRLSILDLSEAGAQPMFTPDGALGIVFNGEIYNYREIRADLEKQGCRFVSGSDTEVLLQLYRRKGTGMFADLRGMYAFALWDVEKRGVLLARDPFGIKPLYFADDGRSIRFASQVRALLSGGAVDTTPDPAGHVGFFLWGCVPEPRTLYKNIRSLGAGSYLWIDEQNGTGRETVHCSIVRELAEGAREPVRLSAEEKRGLLGDALRESLRYHFVSDVPVSLFLSAGLDSTTLTALSSELFEERLNTVTLAFEDYCGTDDDEAPLAEAAARHCGSIQHTIRIPDSDFQQDRARILANMDQPTIDGVNTYFVSKAAALVGVKVALSGVGGDELLGGYPSFQQIPRLVRSLRPLRRAPFVGKGFRWLAAPLLKSRVSPKYAGLLEHGSTYAGAYLLRRGLYMPWELPKVLDADMARQGWRDLEPLLRLEEIVRGVPGSADGDEHLRICALELTMYMRNMLLRDTDWAGMAHSLEIRTPLVDISLLRRIAPLLTGAGHAAKSDLALLPSRPLPDAIRRRPKTGFSVPMRAWLRADAADAAGEKPRTAGEAVTRLWSRQVYGEYTSAAAGRFPLAGQKSGGA